MGWKGKFVIVRDDSGQQYASLAMPTGLVNADRVRCFTGSGPTIPVGTGRTEIDDVAKWLKEMENKGFSLMEMPFA